MFFKMCGPGIQNNNMCDTFLLTFFIFWGIKQDTYIHINVYS